MMTIYTPGETTRTLVNRFRLAMAAKETFRCEWLINRDENMNFVLQRGAGTNKKKIRVCLMTGRSEPISQEMAQEIGALLSQMLKIYNKDVSWIQFGFKQGKGPVASVYLSEAKHRILQEIKINMECIAV